MKSYSCPLFLSSRVMCFFFLSAETSFCLKICFVHSWTISTMTLAVGRSHLASTVFSFCCHGAEAVSVVWATCAGAHGSLINVMYRRNCSEEQEVLAKKKIDRAPLVLGMPCCIKSILQGAYKYCDTCQHSYVYKMLCMQRWPEIENKQILQLCSSVLFFFVPF